MVVTFLLLLVKIGTIVMYHESFLPLTFQSLALLLEHTDHDGLKAMVGEHYYLWTPLLIPAVILPLILCCRFMIRFLSSADDAHRNRVLFCVMCYLLLSLIANARYLWYHDVSEIEEEIYTGHVIMPLSLSIAEIARDGIRAMKPDLNQDRFGFFPADFPKASKAWLDRYGILKDPNPPDAPELPRYDRILIIAIESLDGDFLNSNNPDLPPGLTPGIDALKKRYLSFSNYYSASQPTSWGVNALILSRPDYQLDKNMRNVSLCDILHENGIPSWHFCPVGGEFGDNRKYFQKMFRFDSILFDEDIRRLYPEAKTSGGWGLSDETMYRFTLNFLRSKKPDRYFLLVSTMDTHNPYHVSGPLADENRFHDAFFDSIHTTDDNAARFVHEFTADPELFNDRTLLILTSDHSACHGKNVTHRKILTDPARIPLIFITKNNAAAAFFQPDLLFSTIDLPATFVRMMNKEVPPTFMGRCIAGKKPFAITRDMEEHVQIILPDGSSAGFEKFHPDLRTEGAKAFFEFYTQYYQLEIR